MAQDALSTALGWICLTASDDALTGVSFAALPCPNCPNDVTEQAKQELSAYLRGELRAFSVPLAPGGTEFQRLVWDTLSRVPFGETVTYGALARRLGRPGCARAVASALHRNPIAILIPCHRVVASNGLGGYAFGIERKQALLCLEQGNREHEGI